MKQSKRLFVVAAFVALNLTAQCAYAESSAPLEYQVKASYLYNFIHYIEWPSDALPADSRFNVCVVGAERFGDALDALSSERIGSRELVLRRLDRASQARSARCQVLYLVASEAETANDSIVERGMLTIGESAGFLQRGGIINLVEYKGRIRFEINQQTARTAGLTISSRILSLALNRP